MLNYRMREGERASFPRPEGMSPTLHALLIQRGIATAEQAEEFLHPSASRLRDPMLLSDMGPATAAIRALARPDAKEIPIIALTANAYQEDVQRCLNAGMNAHLSKPIHVDRAVRTIAECLKKK